MAMSVKTRPQVHVFGTVHRTREARKREDKSLYATDVHVETASGGCWVRYWLRDIEEVPGVGEVVALVVTIEDGEYGSLNFERPLNHGDIDSIATQALGAPVAAGK